MQNKTRGTQLQRFIFAELERETILPKSEKQEKGSYPSFKISQLYAASRSISILLWSSSIDLHFHWASAANHPETICIQSERPDNSEWKPSRHGARPLVVRSSTPECNRSNSESIMHWKWMERRRSTLNASLHINWCGQNLWGLGTLNLKNPDPAWKSTKTRAGLGCLQWDPTNWKGPVSATSAQRRRGPQNPCAPVTISATFRLDGIKAIVCLARGRGRTWKETSQSGCFEQLGKQTGGTGLRNNIGTAGTLQGKTVSQTPAMHNSKMMISHNCPIYLLVWCGIWSGAPTQRNSEWFPKQVRSS